MREVLAREASSSSASLGFSLKITIKLSPGDKIWSFNFSVITFCFDKGYKAKGVLTDLNRLIVIMGAVCCCLRDDWEDFTNLNSSVYRNCICLRCFLQNFIHMYSSLFHRGGEHALPSSTQGTASLSSMASLDNSLADTYRSPPRPLPYDADPRYYRLQQDGLVLRREKGSSHLNEETEPLRMGEVDEESESIRNTSKRKEFTCEQGSKDFSSKSSLKLLTAKTTMGFAHIYTSSEDEDVCPTCLDEYTTENPKIVTKCSHHFHLGCIYEWMERSDTCPVCCKVMAFDETT